MKLPSEKTMQVFIMHKNPSLLDLLQFTENA